MGLRGPGAKPRRRPDSAEKTARKRRPPWQKKGLTRAERVIAFIETLPITSGMLAGQKMKLRPWQREIIEAIYATGDNCLRKVRQALVSTPRKQGKTALLVGLALAHLLGPEAEPRGQVYSAAADREQAAIVFREMVAIIEAVEWMAERVNVQKFNKVIEDLETGSIYKALSSDANTKHGLSASFVVYDELAQAPNRELFDVLATSTAARAEPLMVVISTQSPDPNHVMTELVDYGRKVMAGEIEDSAFYACIYSAPDDADPWTEATWYACNPALGDFRSLEEMRTAAAQAQRIPAREAAFRLLYLNQPVDAEARFINRADWDACGGPVNPEALRGRPCWAGLDLSSTTDLTALVLFFPEDGGAVLPFFWLPASGLAEKENKDRVPYLLWRDKGYLETTPGKAINKRHVALRLAEITAAYDLRGVAYDRWRAKDLQVILDEEGIDARLVEWGQGFKDMGPAVDTLETLILSEGIRHGQHPALNMCAASAAVEMDPAGARKLAKNKSTGRIDGLVALAMAAGLHAREPKPVEIGADSLVVLVA